MLNITWDSIGSGAIAYFILLDLIGAFGIFNLFLAVLQNSFLKTFGDNSTTNTEANSSAENEKCEKKDAVQVLVGTDFEDDGYDKDAFQHENGARVMLSALMNSMEAICPSFIRSSIISLYFY